MTDKELYNAIHGELFKDGSCVPNEWYIVKIVDGEKVAIFEAIYPSKGNIRIRKPVSVYGKNYDNETLYNYDVWRFTNKNELKYVDRFHAPKPKEYVNFKEAM
jgi:hypothetical protein